MEDTLPTGEMQSNGYTHKSMTNWRSGKASPGAVQCFQSVCFTDCEITRDQRGESQGEMIVGTPLPVKPRVADTLACHPCAMQAFPPDCSVARASPILPHKAFPSQFTAYVESEPRTKTVRK